MTDTSSGSALKFEIEKFNGTNSFPMWQSTVTNLLVQQGLGDALEADKPAAMNDSKCRDIQRKAVSTIHLSLTTEIKYNVLDVKTPKELMDKLESIYMSKSITNMLCLKRELFGLKMKVGTSLRAHLNEFNRLVTQLASVDEVMKEVDKAVLLINSLTDRYDPVTRALMVGRKTLSLQDVTSAIFEFNERGRSSSRPRVDMSSKECYYCHEMGHIKAYCKKLMEDLGDFMKSKEKNKAGVNVAAADSEEYSDEDVVLMVQEEKKDTRDMWVFDSVCSEHISTKKEWFSKLEKCDKSVYMANNGEERIEGIGSVKLRLHDGSVKMLGNVSHVPKFTRNLISLGKLDCLGYGYSCRVGGLKITKGSMIVMKGVKNSKNLY
ncbi:Zinc finger, CCHC-type [Corchorus capsularis]|uniref:Zinc finger, CCHC-type n=1 Tax=Corchorus capsularis TaxID=210143 RepID=A0A1R3G1B1_COCAP|nr:Zinc finger, CCHC-type [Corchorus capsularis]